MHGINWTISPRLLSGIYVLWFASVVLLALLGVFRLDKDPTPGFLLTFFIFLPGIVFLLFYWKSPSLKQFVHSLDGRMVTLFQCIRMFGPVFYIGCILGAYPTSFGIPAVIMDTTWGVTTPLVASWWNKKPFRKRAFVSWHIAGIIELMLLASLRIMTLPTPLGIMLEDITSEGLNELPWSLLPTFVAANLVLFHLVCAIQGLRRDNSP